MHPLHFFRELSDDYVNHVLTQWQTELNASKEHTQLVWNNAKKFAPQLYLSLIGVTAASLLTFLLDALGLLGIGFSNSPILGLIAFIVGLAPAAIAIDLKDPIGLTESRTKNVVLLMLSFKNTRRRFYEEANQELITANSINIPDEKIDL